MQVSEKNIKCNALIIKVASRCNLNCTYCYMYNMGDTTYKNQPKVMPDDVVDALLEKTFLHCKKHGITDFSFVFHGGEPLLAGFEFYEKFVSKARQRLQPDIIPFFAMQTNATMLTEQWCQLFGKLDIVIGISLDGTPEDNDRYRIDHAGKGSYVRIVQGLKTAQQSPSLKYKPGLLSVLNVNSDPIAIYEHFKSLEVKAAEFLLPDSTYDQPPPRAFNNSETPYADWLIALFDCWINEPNGERISLGMYEQIINSILGGNGSNEGLGNGSNELLVIETNGAIEAVDVLRICGDGFTRRNANVLTHDFDEALDNDLAKLYHASHKKLCRQCRACPVKEICGGGYLPHRHSSKNGFNNPSVYCHDLLKLITHIQNKVLQQMPQSILDSCGVSLLDYEEAKQIIEASVLELSDTDYTTELENFA